MTNKTPKLDARIVQALAANGEASRDALTALIDEAMLTIDIAHKVIETEEPALLDLENSDPDHSRELIASNKLKIERLTLAIPQLQQRIDALDAEQALAEWNTEADRLRSASNKIYDELEKLYPSFLAKIVDLFDRGKRNAAAFNAHLRHAPPGADTWFEAATPHSTFWQDITLPCWTKPYITFPFRQTAEDIAWQTQIALTKAAVDAARMSEQKHAQLYSSSWHEVQKLEQERKAAEDEQAEAELKEKDAAARDQYYASLKEAERRRIYGE